MYYIYSYVEGSLPYYIGKGKGNRAYTEANHSVSVPDTPNIHIISHFDDNIKALIREWEMISLLQLKTEGGILDNKVKGCCPPDRTGTTYKLSEETKQKLRKPKNYVRTAEHSEKIAVQNRGKKHTEEHKDKISTGLKKAFEEGRMKPPTKPIRALNYLVTHPDGTTEEVFNMRVFCDKHNLSRAMMSGVAKGKYKYHRGYQVEYL